MPDEGNERIGISAELREDISEGMRVVAESLDDAGDAATEFGAKTRVAGREAAQGIDSAQKATDRLRDAQGRWLPVGEQVDDTIRKQGRASSRTRRQVDRLSRSLRKAQRNAGSLAMTMMLTKWSLYATGGMAVVGMLSALGAAAVIAIGGLAPMVGVVTALPVLLFAAAGAMLAWKLAGDEAGATLKPLTEAFKAYGDDIRAVMLPGLRAMVRMMRGEFVPVVGGGLIQVGASIGDVARQLGTWSGEARNLNRIGFIFSRLDPIIQKITAGLLGFGSMLLDIIAGALPMVTEMADDFMWLGQGAAYWTNIMFENGRMTAWLIKSYHLLKRVIGVLVDFVIGLYNVFRIAAGYSGELGGSIEDLAYKFRLWSESAEGQERIAKYFADSLPAIREMALLLGAVAVGFAKLAANEDVAPLIAQIRTELLPALGLLLQHFVGDGSLGPAAITAFTALATAIGSIPTGPVTSLVLAIASLIGGIAWLITNVPGLGHAIAYVAAGTLAWKVGLFALGGGVKILRGLLDVFDVLKVVLPFVGRGLLMVGKGVLFIGRAMMAAFLSPVGLVILAIIAVIAIIWLLWTKCAWFRDAVIAVWNWIKVAALATWNWIKEAWDVTVDAIVAAAEWTAAKATAIWTWIKNAWVRSTELILKYWHRAVDPIVAAALWMWDILQPLFRFIGAAAERAFGVFKWIAQVVIFVVVGWFTLMYMAIRQMFLWAADLIQWWWGGVKRVFGWVVSGWNFLTDKIRDGWNFAINKIRDTWNALWDEYVAPKIDAIKQKWNGFTAGLAFIWNALTTAIRDKWNELWDTYVAPKIDWIAQKWADVTAGAGLIWDTFTGKVAGGWQWISDKATGVMDWVSSKWGSFTDWLGEKWRPVGDGITSVWEKLSAAGSAAADVIKGAWDTVVSAIKGGYNALAAAWNSIPGYTVPDFVPTIGGRSFSLPKLPTLWHGGYAPDGMAVVGEHGPEPLVVNGRYAGMVGQNGPEVASIPAGGYVVPNLDTLSALPGLTRSLPGSVAAAVARSVPGYEERLASRRIPESADHRPSTAPDTGNDELVAAVRSLAGAVASNRPVNIDAGGGDVKEAVLAALRQDRRERRAGKRYYYGDEDI